MKPLDFPLLTDENIVPDVVQGLRVRGCDVRSASDEHLLGRPDADLLEHATRQRRVIVTHDLAFGRDAIRAGTPFVGIIYIRPGHISAGFVLAVIDALQTSSVEVKRRSSLSRSGKNRRSASVLGRRPLGRSTRDGVFRVIPRRKASRA